MVKLVTWKKKELEAAGMKGGLRLETGHDRQVPEEEMVRLGRHQHHRFVSCTGLTCAILYVIFQASALL